MFETGGEIVTFTDVTDLRRKVEYYLEHEDERRAIADRARERALRDHTYDRRITDILAFIEERAGHMLANRPPEAFWTAEEAATRPELDTELKTLMEKCPAETPCTLQGVLPHVGSEDDEPQELTEAEGIVLMLNEIVTTARIE